MKTGRLWRQRRTTAAGIAPPPVNLPHAEANGPYSATVGVALAVTHAGSYSPNGAWTATWLWGDGTESGPYSTNDATHVYGAPGSYTITLRITDAAGSATDTAPVTVAAGSATVASVDVTPDPVSGYTGGNATLTARAYTSGDVLIPGKLGTWTTTNAGVASVPSGLAASVTVGFGQAGSATIRCTIDGVQSNAVVVTVVALPSGLWPYLPTNYVVVSSEPFAAIPPDSPSVGPTGWHVSFHPERLSLGSDSVEPGSPPSYMQGLFPAGAAGGNAPYQFKNYLTAWPANNGRLYVGYTLWLDPNWTDNGNAGTKCMFFRNRNYGSDSNHYFGMSVSGNCKTVVGTQFQTTGNNRLWEMDGSVTKGVWHRYEFLISDPGTPGVADSGRCRFWIDGVARTFSRGGSGGIVEIPLMFFSAGQTPGWNALEVVPTYGGGLNPVPYNMAVRYGHIIIAVL